LVCNETPHCREDLLATYPEGICLPSLAVAAVCGTLGNTPCETGRRCETGLAVRCALLDLFELYFVTETHDHSTWIADCTRVVLIQECCRSGICAPALSQPCGIRGFPVCLGRSNLCHQLLSPSFPSMVCVDSSRSEAQPCGVLGTSACLDLECASGLVVHPSTKVCVPPADEPCGAARQTQCFWNGADACQEGLKPKGGICTMS
jgi:hypothetical protein